MCRRYASFFGEASYSVVLDGIGLSWDKLRIHAAPCGASVLMRVRRG
eukprot:COSAG06_NODE_1683_length_8730_cov_3.959912_12_plen_47_part_00